MSLILNIQTFDRENNIAGLSKKDETIDIFKCLEPDSENIHSIIVDLLDRNDLKINSLSSIAICIGPGSFTGLRIGISTAKGLCYALNIPLIAVSVFDIMLFGEDIKSDYIVAITKSMKDTYAAVYNKNDIIKKPYLEKFDNSFFNRLKSKTDSILVGKDFVDIQEELIENNIRFKSNIKPTIEKMMKLTNNRFKAKKFENIYNLSPLYIREFQPTIKEK